MNKTPEQWEKWTPDQFRTDALAVKEMRSFLSSDTGKKLLATIRGYHPTSALIATEQSSPAIIRTAAKLEDESQGSLIGRVIGYDRLFDLLTGKLTVPLQPITPKSRRGGGIPAEPAVIS